jgi:site-specific DNA-adenine methylase
MNAATVQTWAPGELSPKRAVLKYHGGKWMLAPWIISFFPGHKTYVDPPYVRETRNYHGDAYRYEMTDDEHEELARALFECKGFVIVSGYDCELYQELYGSLDRKEMPSKSSGGWRTESLWLSPQASEEISRKDRQALLPIQGELHV